MTRQRTISESITVEGVNVYNGRANSATFHPAIEDFGVQFYSKGRYVPAALESATKSRKAISVSNRSVDVHLVEHLLAATYALKLDNLVIELSDTVCPTVDNCAHEYVAALQTLVQKQNTERKVWKYSKAKASIIFSENKDKPDSWIVNSSDEFSIHYTATYPHKSIGLQTYCFNPKSSSFEEEISYARSPAFLQNKIVQNIVKGLHKLKLHGLSDVNYLHVLDERNPNYGNRPEYDVRYNGEEFVRHKILDIMGTLALTGRQFEKTAFMISKSGHEFDLFALQKLFETNSFIDNYY